MPGPSAKPPSTSKPTLSAKSKSIEAISTSGQSDQALFSPEPFSIQPSSSTAQTAEAVVFTSDARDHERSALILGRLGYVRFVPVSFSWAHAPGQNSPVAVLSFATSGTKSVSLQVTFQASSRFSLAEPWVVVGDVVATAQTSVEVAEPSTRIPAQPLAKTKVKPRLVFAACETLPSAYRC